MLNKEDTFFIEKLLNNKIIYSKLLSNSFGINCTKFKTSNNESYIVKYYEDLNIEFNSIKSETKNLLFMNKLNLKSFPKLYSMNDKYLIISFVENDGLQPNKTKEDLLNAIIEIHKFKNNFYGFDFDTQIGGLRQINKWSNNWIDFFRDYRLGYIYNIISSSNIMNLSINRKIDLLLNNLENYIPKNPTASLLHGDLWEGNILFDNTNFIGFIDPGSFYGHNELEIAYLRWFNHKFIDNNFLNKYNNIINIGEEYLNYEPIYQLYYSLLNVHLWDRAYIKDVRRLLDKLQI